MYGGPLRQPCAQSRERQNPLTASKSNYIHIEPGSTILRRAQLAVARAWAKVEVVVLTTDFDDSKK